MTTSQPDHASDHARPGPAVRHPAGPLAALQALAAALDPDHHTTELVTDDGPVPYLLVASRHAQLGEAIYADDRSYRWPWGQPIAATGNPHAAATKVSHVLAACPAHD